VQVLVAELQAATARLSPAIGRQTG
jgi:hypothetical protein